MSRILITAGTTALAFRVKNSLAKRFDISLATSGSVPSVLKKDYIKLPEASSISFAHEMLKIALDNKIDFILPIELDELTKLSKNLVLFEEYNIRVLVPKPNELTSLNVVLKPNQSLDFVVFDNGKDLINGNQTGLNSNGLGVVSDSESDFMLIAL